MKKYLIGMLAAIVMILSSGCDSLTYSSYASVTPHENLYDGQSIGALEASNFIELQDAVTAQISNAVESFVIYISDMDTEQVDSHMKSLIRFVKEQDPIGAFAVESIEYEVGTNAGRMAVAVNMLYNRTRSEILRIEKTETMDAALEVITEALENCSPGVVVQVENYKLMDITQKAQDYVDSHPDTCMEMPQVSEATYPQSGSVRVIELTFTYQTSREVLRSMQTYVQPVFRAADLNVSGEEEESVKFSRMYAFLMERNDYQFETSITPAYSLLRHGVGDSKAFATVYAAMCRSAGLDCQVITGTRSGEPWTWNLICEDGVYYHVDLIRSNAVGQLQRLYQEDMEGYVWDYSAYPAAHRPVEQEIISATPDEPEGSTEPEETLPAIPDEPDVDPTEPPQETTPPEETVPETLSPQE